MVGFTQEQSCTDGSTDAFILPPSVHPTLLKGVGPVCHNGSAWRFNPNPNPFLPAAARARFHPYATVPSASGAPPRACASRTLRQPSVLAVGRLRLPFS
jgi:hypothetical protein